MFRIDFGHCSEVILNAVPSAVGSDLDRWMTRAMSTKEAVPAQTSFFEELVQVTGCALLIVAFYGTRYAVD